MLRTPNTTTAAKPTSTLGKDKAHDKGKENRKSLHDVFLPSRPKSALGNMSSIPSITSMPSLPNIANIPSIPSSPAPVIPPMPRTPGLNEGDSSIYFDAPSKTPARTPAPTRPKSFFDSMHKRTKSAGTAITSRMSLGKSSTGAVPLTPKAIAHNGPPRVPPPTPATPLCAKTANAGDIPPVPMLTPGLVSKSAGMGRQLNVAVAVSGALRREVNARYPGDEVPGAHNTEEERRDPAAMPSAIPKRVQPSATSKSNPLAPIGNSNLNVAAITEPTKPVPSSPTKRAAKPTGLAPSPTKRGIRSPLRPVPGKENGGYVKFKVKAIEAKNGPVAPSTTTPITPIARTRVNSNVAAATIGGNTTSTRGALRMKDRNVNSIGGKRESVDLGKPKAPGEVEEIEKTVSPRRSLLKKSTSLFPRI